jgi:hypothetical protein
MTLLPDTASLHEMVQACFVAYRRRGVSLSPNDVELLEAWAAHEAPFEVIARGIRKAAEAKLWDAAVGDDAPDSLKVCKREVEAELKKWVRLSAGRTAEGSPAEDFLLARHKKLKAAIKKVTKPHLPAWLAELSVPGDFAASERQEALAALLLLRTLPFAKRASILRKARTLVEKAPVMTAAAFRESLRFHRVALTHHEWGLS